MDPGLNQTRMQMLGEFAELALVLAKDLQQSALVAEDADEKVRYAEAFHRTGRGLRQSLALHAKFERDAELSVEDARLREVKRERSARERRKADIKGQVDALIWTERENLDFDLDDCLEAVEQILDAEAETERFLDTDPQVFVRRLCKALRLPSPLAGEGGPRSGSGEGSQSDLHREPPPTQSDAPAQPLIRPDGHLLPRGEKDERYDSSA